MCYWYVNSSIIVMLYVGTLFLNQWALALSVIRICLVRKVMCCWFVYIISIGICIVLNIVGS